MRAIVCGFVLALLVVASSAQNLQANLNFAGLIKGVNLAPPQPVVPDTVGSFGPQIYIAPSDPNTVLGIIGSDEFYYQTLSAWISQTQLIGAYSQTPITVFLPSPSALKALGAATLRSWSLPQNSVLLTQILKSFIVPGYYPTSSLTNGQVLKTLEGQTLTYNAGNVGGAPILTADLAATNGLVNILGGFVQPADLVTLLFQQGFTTLASLISQSKIATPPLNSQFTVFVPTNNAFATQANDLGHADPLPGFAADLPKLQAFIYHHILAGIVPYGSFRNGTSLPSLQYGQYVHVIVKNCGTYVSGAKIVQSNIPALNGLIHVVDTPIPLNDVLTVATDLGHTTFVTAVYAAGLAPLLQTICARTVFIPTNAAFAALPAGTLANLLLPANMKLLQSIVLFHIVPAEELYTPRFFNTTLLTLSNGQRLGISTNVSGLFVNTQVSIIHSGVVTSTAIGEVITSVLQPRTIAQILADTSAYSTLSILSALTTLSTLFPNASSVPATLFAPVDSAFASLTANQLSQTLILLSLHTSYQVSQSVQWVNGTTLQSVAVPPTQIVIQLPPGQNPTVGNATVLITDLVATNGVVHIISSLAYTPVGF